MTLQSAADDAVEIPDIASAVIFVVQPDATALKLGAAAGINGEALDRLAAAVRDANHPIARTVVDETASFDVTPMAPGGPALRSHLPIFNADAGVVGVLAVAHDVKLDDSQREALTAIAEAAGADNQ